jgi:predicted DNA-binding transcriptional regulator AlpA
MSTTDRPQPNAIEDISIDDELLQLGGEPCGTQDPHWVWCLVRAENDPPRQVWVRYPADEIPTTALRVRNARPPAHDDDGVLVVSSRKVRWQARSGQKTGTAMPQDDLLTVKEFAGLLGIAESSVFELLKKGLPSFKSKHVGRRIKKTLALAWLTDGGAERSRIARRIANVNRSASRTDGQS